MALPHCRSLQRLKQHSHAGTWERQSCSVIIVVDRRDLKTQIADDFDACDYPNAEKTLSVEDL